MPEKDQEVFYLTKEFSFSKGKIIGTKNQGDNWEINDDKFGIIEGVPYLYIFETEKELAIFLEEQCQ